MREALDGAATAFAAAGCDTPRLDAELLLARALGTTRAQLHMHPEAEVTGEAVRTFQAFVRRRAAEREPVAYILGERPFRHIVLDVDRRVLVPRPETELLVELACARVPAGARVIDVCTGSGAVALALARERADLEVWASDISEDALAVARENGRRLAPAVRFEHADLLAGLAGPWDAVLANPPYVPSAELASLEPEIVRHEPAAALDGGADGLDVIRELVAQAAGAGMLAIEVGDGQAAAVEALMRGAGFARTEHHRDLAGIERVVLGLRKPAAAAEHRAQ